MCDLLDLGKERDISLKIEAVIFQIEYNTNLCI